MDPLKATKSKYFPPVNVDGFQLNVELMRYAVAKLLLITRASKLSPLKRVRLIKMFEHEGAGVFVVVGVLVGVLVIVGDGVIVGVRVGVRVSVGVGVNVIVGESVNVKVGDGTVGMFNGRGVLIARVARNCSTIPSRYEAR